MKISLIALAGLTFFGGSKMSIVATKINRNVSCKLVAL